MKDNKQLRRVLYFREFISFEPFIVRNVPERIESRYAEKQINPKFYGTIKVSNLKVVGS